MSVASEKLRCVPSSLPSSQPPKWGARIKHLREAQGRSIRQAAASAGLAGTYWGQVERGRKTLNVNSPRVKPTRQTLALMAETLRMTDKDRAALMDEAGYGNFVSPSDNPRTAPALNLTGLRRRDVTLLQAIADRLRESAGEGSVTPIKRQPARTSEPDLRVARKRDPKARPLDQDEDWDS